MNLICALFGHRPAFGYGDTPNQGYFRVAEGALDGVNRQHASLYCECERCNVEYKVGNIHIPQKYVNVYLDVKKRF